MNQRDIEKAIEREVEEWPEASVSFTKTGTHPKAKLAFGGLLLSVVFAGTPGSQRGVHNTLSEVRRSLKKLGAVRTKPEPTAEEDEAPYRKPNDGAAKRPDPVERKPVEPKATIPEQLVEAGVVDKAAVQAAGSAETYARAGYVEVEEEEGENEVNFEARRAALLALIEGIVDGVYFDLPDTVYHAVPRLSSSGLQKLCVSPATFWRGSWLDPEKADLDEDATKAQVLGKAYHCARLEPGRFHDCYVRGLEKADFDLTSDSAIKAALKDLGEPQTQGAETIAERGQRLLDAGYDGTILAVAAAAWESERGGRIAIPGQYFDQIVTDMERIAASGEIAELLSEGEPEVSIFWTDKHGLKMKCRVDYLKASKWTDLKTFDNSRGKALGQALADAVRYNRLYVQAATYREGIEAVRVGGLDIIGEATEAQRDLIANLRLRPSPLKCWFVFTEKGGVPNILGREFRFHGVTSYRETEINALVEEDNKDRVREALGGTTALYSRALWEIDKAKRDFVLYSQVYEPGQPWFPVEPLGHFDDLDFNSYWLKGD